MITDNDIDKVVIQSEGNFCIENPTYSRLQYLKQNVEKAIETYQLPDSLDRKAEIVMQFGNCYISLLTAAREEGILLEDLADAFHNISKT